DQLEQRAIHLQIPTAYGSSLYTMRVHIGLIRSHLESILTNENIQREETQSPPSRQGSDLSDAPPPSRKSAGDRAWSPDRRPRDAKARIPSGRNPNLSSEGGAEIQIVRRVLISTGERRGSPLIRWRHGPSLD